MADLNRIQAIVFDSYGTLFDLNQTNEECEKQYPENGAKIAQSWRQKQLQYSWLRALMDRYLDFKNITKDALVFVLKENQLAYDETLSRCRCWTEIIEATCCKSSYTHKWHRRFDETSYRSCRIFFNV